MSEQIAILKIKKLLDGLLTWVTDDYNDHIIDPTNSWIYSVFGEEEIDNFKFMDQSKSLILRTSKSSRKCETRIMFDNSRANMPTIHIHMPSESKGSIQGLQAGFTEEKEIVVGYGEADAPILGYTNEYSASFRGQYDLIVTSNNSFETILIYELLKRLLLAAADTLQNMFLTFDTSGKELLAKNDFMPANIFFRSISLYIDEFVTVESLNRKKNYSISVSDINFKGEGIE